MKYESSAAFRRALEDRLRAQSITSGMPLVRLRKMVAFDRFLARLAAADVLDAHQLDCIVQWMMVRPANLI